MGLLDTVVEKVKDAGDDVAQFFKPSARKGRGDADNYLLDELDRFENYIPDEDLGQIVDDASAMKHAVKKIGKIGDTAKVLGFRPGQLFYGASRSAQRKAAKYYARKYWKKNLLNDKILTKSGKEIAGKMLSKNIYVKEVSYVRAGKTINYLQARNINSGRIVGKHALRTLIGKTLNRKL